MYSTAKCSGLIRCLAAAVVFAFAVPAAAAPAGSPAPKVDFSYAFATPHRMTVGRPDASDRTLLDLQPGSLRLAWSYDNLTLPNYPPLTFRTPPTLWSITVTPQIEGHTFARSRWTRVEGVLPALENFDDDPLGSLRMEAVGGQTAAIVRIEMVNRDFEARIRWFCAAIPEIGAKIRRGSTRRRTSATISWPAGTIVPTAC